MKKMNLSTFKKDFDWKAYLFMVIGAIFYALSVALFLSPAGIVAGGVTGLSVLLNKLFTWDIGLLTVIINIPIFLLGLKLQGFKFILRAFLTVATLGLFTDLFVIILEPIIPMTDNALLAAMYGGIAQGIGIGCFIRFKVSSGGTELLGRVIQRFVPSTSIAICTAILDALVVLSGAIFLSNPENILYALVVVFISAKVSDVIVLGIDKARLCHVITDKPEELSAELLSKSPRGITYLKGTGMYTNKEHGVLLTCVKTRQLPQFKQIVKLVDPNTFVIVGEALEVHGKGFSDIER